MQIIDLSDYTAWLIRRKLTDDKRAPYFAQWVRRYLLLPHITKHLSEQDRRQAFGNAMAKDPHLQDWQRQQADYAVDLYLNGYLKEVQTQDTGPTGDIGSGKVNPGISVLPPSEGHAGRDPGMNDPVISKARELIRLRHYSYRTETTYLDWSRRYLAYCTEQRMDWREAAAARAFLAYLAVARNVAASTQNQAFAAILFLLRDAHGISCDDLQSVRAKRGPKLPVVFSVEEVQRVLNHADGNKRLMLELTYGAGLRVSETLRLRVKDLDYDQRLVIVRAGKGDKDRSTLLPKRLINPLQEHLVGVRKLHEEDLAAGFGEVYLPFALDVKYPNAARE